MLQMACRRGVPAIAQVSRCSTISSHNSTETVSSETPSLTSHGASANSTAPILRRLNEPLPVSASAVRQAWVENVDTVEGVKRGLVELHPEVFAVFPKLHLIHDNIRWQTMYQRVDYACTRTRAEKRGGGRKPWPQKGTGRARHGSIRSPLWRGGGVAHGPRGPKSHFFMLPFSARVGGLCATLSAKLAQGDLRLVEHLELPSPEAGYLQQLADRRLWGPSILFVDDTDEMPPSISAATSRIPHFNLMPVYGLNVHTMLKHATLVLTVAAAERVQERLLHAQTLPDTGALHTRDASMLS